LFPGRTARSIRTRFCEINISLCRLTILIRIGPLGSSDLRWPRKPLHLIFFSSKNNKIFTNKKTNKKSKEVVTKKQVRDMINTRATITLPKLYTSVNHNGSVTSAIIGPVATQVPPQGVGPYNRVSDSIRVRHIDHRIVLYGGDSQNVVRLIAIQMKAPLSISANDLLFAGPTSARDILSFLNPYSEKQYHLLFDKSYALNISGSNGTIYLNFKMIPKIKTWNFRFGTNIIESGQIYYFLVSDSDVAPSPVVEWNSMIEFDDDL
jgi:hypothetical protein